MTLTWRSGKNDKISGGTPAPLIQGSPQSEAIDALLQRLSIYIYNAWPSNRAAHVVLSEAQLQRRWSRVYFLEACRHFLISIQFLLAFLLMRGNHEKKTDEGNHLQASQRPE